MTKDKNMVDEKNKKDSLFETEGELVIDVWQTPQEIIIQAPVAGVEADDLEIILEDGILRIKGERKMPSRPKSADFMLQECYWGVFTKEIVLPTEINNSKITASTEQGILTIKLAKKKQASPKKIKVETQN